MMKAPMLNERHNAKLAQGWQCPSCGRAHAPEVKTCPDPARKDQYLAVRSDKGTRKLAR